MLLYTIHAKWPDPIFRCLSFLGDGLFSILLAVALFIGKQRKLSFYIIVAYKTWGIAAQVLNRFYTAPGPQKIISHHLYSSFIEGLRGYCWGSFPLGHSTSIFALATSLALYTNKNIQGLYFLLMAILVGYSWIYLGQYFLQDVLAGVLPITSAGLLVSAFVPFPENLFRRKGTPEQHNNSYTPGLAGN